MKPAILAILAVGLCGCATINDPNLSFDEKANKIADDYEPIIQSCTRFVSNRLTLWLERNPEKRVSVREDILRITTLIDTVILKGTLDPQVISSSLKIKEPEIEDMLRVFMTVYVRIHSEAQKIGHVEVVTRYLKIFASGIKEAVQ